MGFFSTVGTIAGGAIGGPTGAMIGGGIGSAAEGGGGGGGTFSSGIQKPVTGFTSPGMSAKYDMQTGMFNIAETEGRKTLIDQIKDSLYASSAEVLSQRPALSGAFGTAIDATKGFAERVAPGVSDLRESRLSAIENARLKSMSSLTENLARRRIGGSSFGANQAAQRELAFAEEAERVEAESFLQELDLSNQFLEQRLHLEVGQIDAELQNFLSAQGFTQAASQTELDNQDFLAGLATQLSTNATTAATALKAQDLKLAADEDSTAGKALGSIDFASIGDMVFGGGSGGGTFGEGWSSSPDTTSDIVWN